MSDDPQLTAEDFELLDGTRENTLQVQRQVKDFTAKLETELGNRSTFEDFIWEGVGRKNPSPYTSRPNKQSGDYWQVVWIGLAHRKYRETLDRPQDGVQLQFAIRSQDSGAHPPADIALHLNDHAPSVVHEEVRTDLERNRDRFIRQLNNIEEYQVRIEDELWSVEKITDDWDRFLSSIDNHFSVFYPLSRDAVDELGEDLTSEIVNKFTELLPLYSLMADTPRTNDTTDPIAKPRRGSEIARQLDVAQQLVFHGPPGTGKTYLAQQFARWWLSEETADTPREDQLELVTFHPSFSYEDFVEGLTTTITETGDVAYKYRDGVFKQICQRAANAYNSAEVPEEAPPYVLIIDEINRGNLAQIFGETITLIEADKRLDAPQEIKATLAHSGESFVIPPNLYIIGTMNTADRSIALVDAALRRRFRFIACPPNLDVLYREHEFTDLAEVRRAAQDGESAYESLLALSILAFKDLNEIIIDTPDLGKGKQIGHSYLLGVPTPEALVDAWRFEILPLLEEYYFSQFSRIQQELFRGSGEALFDQSQQRIAAFDPTELAQSLSQLIEIEPSPAIAQIRVDGE